MAEWWWRLRCAYWYCVRLRTLRSWAWSCAWAGEYDPEMTPHESVDEELSYWSE